jgi:predicted CopG family antitoxin
MKTSNNEIEKLKKKIKQRDQKIKELHIKHTEFIKTQTVMPDVVARVIADNFAVIDEGNKLNIVPLDAKGNHLLSIKHPGETASIEEAAQFFVETRHKELLLPDDLRSNSSNNQSPANRNGSFGDLLSQYNAAKKKNDFETMTSLKLKMNQAGIKSPL